MGYLSGLVRAHWMSSTQKNKLASKNWTYAVATLAALGAIFTSCDVKNLRINIYAVVVAIAAGKTVSVIASKTGEKLHDAIIEERWLRELELEADRMRKEEALGMRAFNPDTLPWRGDAWKIVKCLKRYGVDVAVLNDTKGLTLTRFTVIPTGLDDGISEIQSRANELKMALNAPKRPDVHASDDGVAIDVPLPEAERSKASFWKYVAEGEIPVGGIHIPVGLDFYKNVVTMNICSASTPHMLIAGITGSGKSELTRNVVFGLACWYPTWAVEIQILDPKREFKRSLFSRIEMVKGHIQERSQIERKLALIVEEMERRYRIIQDYVDISDYNASAGEEFALPQIVIIGDELPEICRIGDCENHLVRIATLGRAAGIHLVVNAQRPSGDIMNTQLRSNLGVRAMLRVASTLDSYIITGNDEDGRGYYLMGMGDMWYLDGSDDGRRLQGFHLEPSKYEKLPLDWKGTEEAALEREIEQAVAEVPGLSGTKTDPANSIAENLSAMKELYQLWRANQESEKPKSKSRFIQDVYEGVKGGPKFTACVNELEATVDMFLHLWLADIPEGVNDRELVKHIWSIPLTANNDEIIRRKIEVIKVAREKGQKLLAASDKEELLVVGNTDTVDAVHTGTNNTTEEVLDIQQLADEWDEAKGEAEVINSSKDVQEETKGGSPIGDSVQTQSKVPAPSVNIDEATSEEFRRARQGTLVYDLLPNPDSLDEVIASLHADLDEIASTIALPEVEIISTSTDKENNRPDREVTEDLWEM